MATHHDTTPLTIRRAHPDDEAAVARLAALDSSRPPGGEILLAEIGGTPYAALSIDDFHAVSDPFRPESGELVLMLADRARRIRRAQRTRRPRRPWTMLWEPHAV